MVKGTKDSTTGATANPFAELGKMFEQFQVPGLDMSALAESRRKDVEALMQANKAVFDGMQALASKQAEMFRQAMADIQEAAGSAGTDRQNQAELVRKAYEKTLADMKELADIARQSQMDALANISQRATQNMQEIRDLVQKK